MNASQKIDTYIAEFPKEVQEKLASIRKIILEEDPAIKEDWKYNMPAFVLNGPLVYFAGYKNHIGFYAIPTGHKAFEEELKLFKQGKGSVQFPLDSPLPLELIKKIVAFRVAEQWNKKNKINV